MDSVYGHRNDTGLQFFNNGGDLDHDNKNFQRGTWYHLTEARAVALIVCLRIDRFL